MSESGATLLVVRPAVASRLSGLGLAYDTSAPEPPGGPKQSASVRVGTVTPLSTMYVVPGSSTRSGVRTRSFAVTDA